MKVRCIIDDISDIKDSSTVKRLNKNMSNGKTDLKKNKEYCVYGINFKENSPWYYLCLEHPYFKYPIAYPAELFEITDRRLSKYWGLSIKIWTGGVISKLVIHEWVEEPYLHERLIDGDPEAVSLFAHYKELMDRE